MTSFIDFLGMTPFILIILGILLIVLQFYVEYESSGALDEDNAKKRQDEIITKNIKSRKIKEKYHYMEGLTYV